MVTNISISVVTIYPVIEIYYFVHYADSIELSRNKLCLTILVKTKQYGLIFYIKLIYNKKIISEFRSVGFMFKKKCFDALKLYFFF